MKNKILLNLSFFTFKNTSPALSEFSKTDGLEMKTSRRQPEYSNFLVYSIANPAVVEPTFRCHHTTYLSIQLANTVELFSQFPCVFATSMQSHAVVTLSCT